MEVQDVSTLDTRFLSTLSLRRATDTIRKTQRPYVFLSTLSLRRATGACIVAGPVLYYFYLRSPCGERPQDAAPVCPGLKFLSTLSLRRATDTIRKTQRPYVFLSTLSLRRATGACIVAGPVLYYFYLRSPCGERRQHMNPPFLIALFLSTLSLRRATDIQIPLASDVRISIHALLAESDTLIFNEL